MFKMDFSILKDILALLLSVGTAYIVMRERVLKLEIKVEGLQKDSEEQKERFNEHKDRVYEALDEIRQGMHDILLKLERNNVR